MQFDYDNPALETALAGARSLDEVNAALVPIVYLGDSFFDVRGHKLFAPELDRQVARLAGRIGLGDRPMPQDAKGNDNVVILATRFYDQGGHSRVAADIARLIGAERTTLVLTDTFRQLSYRELVPNRLEALGYPQRSTVILSAPGYVEKIVELHGMLAAIRPTRIFLLNHHMDAVAVAGAWPFRDVVDYVHHGDYQPALGATLPFSRHADPTYTCHPACKARHPHAAYVGMTVPEAPPAPPRQRPEGRPLRIATCGSLMKYQQAARYRWADFAAAAMQESGTELFHIGDEDPEFAAELSRVLAGAGVDPALYHFTGVKPDLRAALLELEIDAFLGSYPIGGGKANLDAMAAGLAPVVPAAVDLGELTLFKSPLQSWIEITDPSQVPDALTHSLALSKSLRGPLQQALLQAEFARFERFVLGSAMA